MNLSIVLWNCHGKSPTESRVKSMKKTYERWCSHKTIPTIVLAQEVKGGIPSEFWRERARYNPHNNTETACFAFRSARRVKFIPLNPKDEVLKDRIKCCIVIVGSEKFLICSYHGQYKATITKRKDSLKTMLTIVEKTKTKNNCCAALVGGDYNLVSRVCTEFLSDSSTQAPIGAKVYDDYITPSWRKNLIDFIIAWPKERFLQQKCDPIPIEPPSGTEITPGSLFDHAPIRYEFILTLPKQKLQSMIGQAVDEHLSASLQISLSLADKDLVNSSASGSGSGSDSDSDSGSLIPKWEVVIPKANFKSTMITKDRSDDADKIISILLCYEHFRHQLHFPEIDDTIAQSKWQAVMTSCLLRGINIYESEDCAENLSIETAIEIVNKYNEHENIKINGKKIQQEIESLPFSNCLAKVAKSTAVVLNTTDSKTISFVHGVDNESVILIDSHLQNDIGLVIRKISKENFGDASKCLPQDMQKHEEWELTIVNVLK